MFKLIFLLALLIGCSFQSLLPRNELTCEICVDIITDIDEFITDQTTEDQILDFFNQICKAVDQLIPGLGETCTNFLYNNGYGIIESIVHENLNPEEVCIKFGLCP